MKRKNEGKCKTKKVVRGKKYTRPVIEHPFFSLGTWAFTTAPLWFFSRLFLYIENNNSFFLHQGCHVWKKMFVL